MEAVIGHCTCITAIFIYFPFSRSSLKFHLNSTTSSVLCFIQNSLHTIAQWHIKCCIGLLFFQRVAGEEKEEWKREDHICIWIKTIEWNLMIDDRNRRGTLFFTIRSGAFALRCAMKSVHFSGKRSMSFVRRTLWYHYSILLRCLRHGFFVFLDLCTNFSWYYCSNSKYVYYCVQRSCTLKISLLFNVKEIRLHYSHQYPILDSYSFVDNNKKIVRPVNSLRKY